MSALLDQVKTDLAGFAYDPVGFVYWAYPWGKGELAGRTGPYDWQLRDLEQTKEALLDGKPARRAVKSGHGPGKSALLAWKMQWAFCTFPGCKGIVTAGTETQLRTKTWPELHKWHRLSICRDLFRPAATSYFSRDPTMEKEWRLDIIPWNEKNPEAFQGLHNLDKRLIILFDEGSQIADSIYEATMGALTDADTEIIWGVYSNPTRNSGYFFDCFPEGGGRFEAMWETDTVDSRDVDHTNKEEFERWIEAYGIDHDLVRVRVRGEFPRTDATAFIPYELAKAAEDRTPQPADNDPVILGVDVARYGADKSVIYPRQGLDAKSRGFITVPSCSTVDLADQVVLAMRRWGAQVACVDGTGVGGGVVDQLERRRVNVVDVQFGARPAGTDIYGDGVVYANRKAEIFGSLRGWLGKGAIAGRIPGTDRTVAREVSSILYSYARTRGQTGIRIEPKDLFRRREGYSHDVADALALTFAQPWLDQLYAVDAPVVQDYNPFSTERICA